MIEGLLDMVFDGLVAVLAVLACGWETLREWCEDTFTTDKPFDETGYLD